MTGRGRDGEASDRPWLVRVPREAKPQVYAEGPGFLIRVVEVEEPSRWAISIRNHDSGKTTVVHWCDDHASALLYATTLGAALQSWYMPVEIELFR